MHTFQLPKLPYAYDALKQWIDAETMELHHSKHHQGYVNKLNAALASAGVKDYPTDLVAFCCQVGSYHHAGIRNNLGGHYNHTLFWDILTPKGLGKPSGELAKGIKKSFGSMQAFIETFNMHATGQFGSGWAWLSVNKEGKLFVSSTPNQDNPVMDITPVEKRGIPILGLDVWEHAYYLSYRNRRPEYVEAFWQMVDWDKVSHHYTEALKQC